MKNTRINQKVNVNILVDLSEKSFHEIDWAVIGFSKMRVRSSNTPRSNHSPGYAIQIKISSFICFNFHEESVEWQAEDSLFSAHQPHSVHIICSKSRHMISNWIYIEIRAWLRETMFALHNLNRSIQSCQLHSCRNKRRIKLSEI